MIRRILPLLFLLLTGCISDDISSNVNEEDKLNIVYNISGADSKVLSSRAIGECSQEENKVKEIYAFFFLPGIDGSGKYIGMQIVSTNDNPYAGTGSASCTLPDDFTVKEAFRIIMIANYSDYTKSSTSDYFDSLLEDKTAKEAEDILTFNVSTSKGASQSRLPMVSISDKAEKTNQLSVNFTRMVSRIDIKNSVDLSNFKLVSAELWNCRKSSQISACKYISDDYIDLTDNIGTSSDGLSISASLYTFENQVLTPTINDKRTTCLIIGGYYAGSSKLTYYRVNVVAPNCSQDLERNHIYTINITNVKCDGSGTKTEAADEKEVKVEYIVNDWDNSGLKNLLIDEHGNRLTVSVVNVIFGVDGGSTDIDVSVTKSETNPINDPWKVSALSGDNAANFTASKKDDTSLTVSAPKKNNTSKDYFATVYVEWGGLKLPITLKQLNPTKTVQGLNITPSTLYFSNSDSVPKSITVDLLGSCQGIDPSKDIKVALIYDNSDFAWLNVNYKGGDKDTGIFYFDVLPDKNTTGVYRNAQLKVSVNQDGSQSTGSIPIIQSNISHDKQFTRTYTVEVYEKLYYATDYTIKGTILDFYKQLKGFPENQCSQNDLNFSIADSKQYKYVLSIQSSGSWRIVTDPNAGNNLTFSMTEHEGDPNTKYEVEILAAREVKIGWSGMFAVEFEDGQKVTYNAYQTGIMWPLGENSSGLEPTDVYYYSTFIMNNKVWLDRNLGATAGVGSSGEYYGAVGGASTIKFGDIPISKEAAGAIFTEEQAKKACPIGFKLGSKETGSGEWDWILEKNTNGAYTRLKHNTTKTMVGKYNICYVFYVQYSFSPEQLFYIPNSSVFRNYHYSGGNFFSRSDAVYYTKEGFINFPLNTGVVVDPAMGWVRSGSPFPITSGLVRCVME